jgi:hypothetical protein
VNGAVWTISISLGLALLFGLYLGYETWRWLTGNPSGLTTGQFRRRLAGGLLLEASLGLWLAEETLLSHGHPAPGSHAQVAAQLLCLLGAALFTLLALMLAVREWAFLVRQYARMRGDAIRAIANGVERENGSS